MKSQLAQLKKFPTKWLWLALGGLALVAAAAAVAVNWLPILESLGNVLPPNPSVGGEHDSHAGHDHEGHDHAHDDSESIELSEQARKNIGLRVGEVVLDEFDRKITVPGIVVERPGQTNMMIAAPFTGIVTGVSTIRGETVASGDRLFTLRLTHEDLVQAQTEFLKTLGQLDVERRELERLDDVSSGAIPRRTILERQYEVEKLEAALRAEREALRLHGLSTEQVERIVTERTLVRELQVTVPMLHAADASVHSEIEGHAHTGEQELKSGRFVVEELDVQVGEAVEAGRTLAHLADYGELFVEGRAFQQDAAEVVHAAENKREVTLVLDEDLSSPASEPTTIPGLSIVYIANKVERDSRALPFYVALPNDVVRREDRGEHEFVTWRYKPGQRLQVRVPVRVPADKPEKVIVLPTGALAQEGAESFVFVENGDHFDRRPVHVLYRDQFDAVIANDGSLFPGETVAVSAAHQLQMALKNKSGGAVDPHAGHNH
jgi:multidrug efflux pump subunit AcrA (membrane-fusion protein)